jgi:HAD superfamily hydrolase (TIGR01484 family)
MKSLVVFDLDGTLAKSKSPLDPGMADILDKLMAVMKVAVISGGAWSQFEKQLLANLPRNDRLKQLSLLPTSGTKFLRYDGQWTQLYAENLTLDDKTKIIDALNKALDESGFRPEKHWGDVIEDRDSQITMSALGQEAPLDVKCVWDPDFEKRKKIKAILDPMIPEFCVTMGGASSIDVTRPGVDKGYGIHKLKEVLGIPIEEMIFVGDALFPGGNDEPARKTGATCIKVRDPEETGRVIEAVIACVDGGPMVDIATDLPTLLRPDATRTVLRPFVIEDPSSSDFPRTRRVIDRILTLDEAGVRDELGVLTAGLEERHRDVNQLFRRRYEELRGPMADIARATPDQCNLIGAYFSEEFSFESAALFNPSVVSHPDQSNVEAGGLRILVSLRGIGEGHISSLAFRTGTWGADGAVIIDEPSKYAVGPRIERTQGPHGELIVHLLCDGAHDISENVIYPFMPSQGRGIEDVRLVEFIDDDGAKDYRGTYTAFNGTEVRQGLLRTNDFKTFEMRGVRGDLYRGKGMALFPRKIDGRYTMLGRQDNENIWLLSSHEFDAWSGGEKIIAPRWPWEFIQIGNCGSPIEVDEGWLVLTHGVGAVRSYCIGACLLDKEDLSKVLARTSKPLIVPDGNSRGGYVPNVVYSCGALVRNRTLLLPYGVADNFAAFTTIELDTIIKDMT